MSEILRIWKALNAATTNLPEDRQSVIDGFTAITDLQNKMAKIREELVEAHLVYTGAYDEESKNSRSAARAIHAVDLIDSINGI